jgi:HSP20 family molecular chaperone IbpA
MITTTFDDLFDSLFTIPHPTYNRSTELTDDLDIHLSVPGCSEKDVEVELGEKLISVKAEASVEGFDFKLNKSYFIPNNADRDNITATVKDGLLTISLKRKVEKLKVKKLL